MNNKENNIKNITNKIEITNLPFINGEYISSPFQKTLPVINPALGNEITQIRLCTDQEIDNAVKSAREAFDRKLWRGKPLKERKNLMLNFAKEINSFKEELAYLESIDTGKPITHSLNIDLPATIECIEWYAQSIDKIYGSIAPTDEEVSAFITKEPFGVIASIIPWNFPLYIGALKIAPALMTGNSIIIKPSEKASLSLLKLGEISLLAGIPKGVINIVTGFGKNTGEYIGCHQGIDAITFTGSTKVGKLFLQYSAHSNMKKVFLECGGKSPCIIFSDYKELNIIAKEVAFNVMFNQGAVCGAPALVLVEKSIEQDFSRELIKQLDLYQPNDPLKFETRMGAIIDEEHLRRVQSFISNGKKEGAYLTHGGEQVFPLSNGFFLQPTLFTNVSSEMKIAKEEIFGPVISILNFSSVDELLHIANNTIYGLSASVWSASINKIIPVIKNVRAGIISVNSISDGNITVPFGGYKQSGIGRDRSLQAIENYVETKVIWIKH
jgi:acyl-CoA reductase-like NAD-dependent aldehyde dehydrogenase